MGHQLCNGCARKSRVRNWTLQQFFKASVVAQSPRSNERIHANCGNGFAQTGELKPSISIGAERRLMDRFSVQGDNHRSFSDAIGFSPRRPSLFKLSYYFCAPGNGADWSEQNQQRKSQNSHAKFPVSFILEHPYTTSRPKETVAEYSKNLLCLRTGPLRARRSRPSQQRPFQPGSEIGCPFACQKRRFFYAQPPHLEPNRSPRQNPPAILRSFCHLSAPGDQADSPPFTCTRPPAPQPHRPPRRSRNPPLSGPATDRSCPGI